MQSRILKVRIFLIPLSIPVHLSILVFSFSTPEKQPNLCFHMELSIWFVVPTFESSLWIKSHDVSIQTKPL